MTSDWVEVGRTKYPQMGNGIDFIEMASGADRLRLNAFICECTEGLNQGI